MYIYVCSVYVGRGVHHCLYMYMQDVYIIRIQYMYVHICMCGGRYVYTYLRTYMCAYIFV